MPLEMRGLKAARCDVTKNTFLKPVWQAVENYNLNGGRADMSELKSRFESFQSTQKLPPQKNSELTRKADALQQIMMLTAGYLTCKPPETKAGVRTDRWDALSGLMADVTREAERIGVKLVEGPVDFRATGSKTPNVWLEVIDPKHRDFGAISNRYEEWKTDRTALNKKMPFFTWVGERDINDIIEYDKGARYQVERGVNGSLSNIDGHTIDTTGDKSHRGGAGWGIYAIDTEGNMFVGRHNDTGDDETGSITLRHVSLTGGRPILAAGEICVVNGEIKAISNETGHYKLGAKLFLSHVKRSANVPDHAVIKVVVADENGIHAEAVVAKDFRKPGEDSEVLDRKAASLLVPQVDWSKLPLKPEDPAPGYPPIGYPPSVIAAGNEADAAD